MNEHGHEIAKKILKTNYDKLTETEKKVIQKVAERTHISRNIVKDYDASLTFGQRLADRVATLGGSWPFIMLFGVVMIIWIVLNSFVLIRHNEAFDPYPYILLNLALSMLAAIQAPVILMSQNRQAAKDRLDAAHDYEVNLKSELEILGLHEKIDQLREQKWAELISIQQEQIQLLTQLLHKEKTG